MRIFNTLDTKSYSTFPPDLFTATAEERSVDRTVFIATEFHGIPPGVCVEICRGASKSGRRVSQFLTRWYNACSRETMLNLTGVVRQLKKERERAQRQVERFDVALKVLGGLGSLNGRFRGVRMVAQKRRTMSPAARKRIAAAQRTRWAKWKATRRNK